jgi:hypothetical protein
MKTRAEWRKGPTREERNRPRCEYTLSVEARAAVEEMALADGISRSEIVDAILLVAFDKWKRAAVRRANADFAPAVRPDAPASDASAVVLKR